MYTAESKNYQYSFTHDWFVMPKLDENHELIKISETIDWANLSDKLTQFYCPDNGRPTKPSRAKVGLLILKHLCRFFGDDTIDLIRRDLYAQYQKIRCHAIKSLKKVQKQLRRFAQRLGLIAMNLKTSVGYS